MATSSARDALLAGPRLVRRAPLSCLVWVLLRVVEQYATLLVLLAARQGGANPAAGSIWAVLAALPFEAVLVAAALRAVLRPAAGAFAFLRVGATEAKMAGLLLLGGLAGAIVALPVSLAITYLAFFLQQRLLAGAVLTLGSIVAALALMRFAPAPAVLVDEGRVDLRLALRASRGRYWVLAEAVILAALGERLLDDGLYRLFSPPPALSWTALASPLRLGVTAGHGLIATAALLLMAGAVTVVWRDFKQTLS